MRLSTARFPSNGSPHTHLMGGGVRLHSNERASRIVHILRLPSNGLEASKIAKTLETIPIEIPLSKAEYLSSRIELFLTTNQEDLNKKLEFLKHLSALDHLSTESLQSYNDLFFTETVSKAFNISIKDGTEEGKGYLKYSLGKKEYKKYADVLAENFENNYSFKGRTIEVLTWCETNNYLKECYFFLNNLLKLKDHNNTDRSTIVGIKRGFTNLEEVIAKNQCVSGIFFEAEVAIALTKAGFSIKEISVREYNGTKLISTDGLEREIDIIAEKEYDGEKTIFNIEVKSNPVTILLSEGRNCQIGALVEMSKRQNRVPIVIIPDRITIISNSGTPVYQHEKTVSSKDLRQVDKFLQRYPELLIWRIPKDKHEGSEELNFTSSAIHKKQIS